jgi:type IX secretion system PorP/SprF family membrane protein
MKKYFIVIILIISGFFGYTQDVHFSFFEYSPAQLNPALAGANSSMQAVINYRNQWSSIGVPFNTIQASFDTRLNEGKRNRKGILAAGLNAYNDRAGKANLTTSMVHLQLAYHVFLNDESTLGLGVNVGTGQRSINSVGDLQWASQHDGYSYNPIAPSGEDFEFPSFSFLDAGAGLLYTYYFKSGYMNQNNERKLNIGFSTYHLNRPYYSFIQNENERLFMRYVGFINADIGIERTRGVVQPGIYYQRQGPAQEILLGLNYKYIIHEGSKHTGFTRPISFYTGVYYRALDAMIGRVMFEWDMYQIGFAYDINLSGLTPVTRTVGGFELFLRFHYGDGGGFRQKRSFAKF